VPYINLSPKTFINLKNTLFYMFVVYIPCKDKEEAKKISRHLLEKKLIGCANIFDVDSIYWWGKEIKEDSEAVLIGKTKSDDCKEIEEEVKKIHSYSCPCIMGVKVDSINSAYKLWLEMECH